MPAYPNTRVHTADNAVPPLGEDVAGLLEDLAGINPGVDQIVAGCRWLMLEQLTRDETQTTLATLAGADGTDVAGLLAEVVRRLTNPDTNPCLRTLDPAVAADVQRIGRAVGDDMDTTVPRDLVGEAIARIDPYTDPADITRTHLDGGPLS